MYNRFIKLYAALCRKIFVKFQGNFCYRFGLQRMILAGILDTDIYLEKQIKWGGLEVNFVDVLGS